MKSRSILLRLLTLILLLSAAAAMASETVTLAETSAEYILDNGIVTARVAKASGDLVSLRYGDLEMLATFLKEDGTPGPRARPAGIPSHRPESRDDRPPIRFLVT